MTLYTLSIRRPVLAIVMAMTAATGCSPKSIAGVTSDAGPAEAAANAGPSRGMITVYHEPG